MNGLLRWVNWGTDEWHLRFDGTGETTLCGDDPKGLAVRVRQLKDRPDIRHEACLDAAKVLLGLDEEAE